MFFDGTLALLVCWLVLTAAAGVQTYFDLLGPLHTIYMKTNSQFAEGYADSTRV